MELRETAGVHRVAGASAGSFETDVPLANLDSTDGEAPVGNSLDDQVLIPSVLILESPEHYQAVVSFNSSRGDAYRWGSALEPRYKKHWRQGGDRGLVLEEVKEENSFASRLCLTSAWHEAISHVERSYGADSIQNGQRHLETRFGGPLLTLLRLDSSCAASADFSPNFRMVCQFHLQSLATLGSSS